MNEIVKGGQGRTAREIEDAGWTCWQLFLGILIVLAAGLLLSLCGCGRGACWTPTGNFNPGGDPCEIRKQVRAPERGEPGFEEYWTTQQYRGRDER